MSLTFGSSLPIGVFDSGLGGLTVLREITRLLPGESTLYLGDTARVPYGTKSKKTVTSFSLENADFLQGEGIKLLVVACNTASAYSLSDLVEYCSVPVIGVIESGALAAAKKTNTNNIGVIGTEGTINSDAYGRAIRNLLPNANVMQKACPLLVPLTEEGWIDHYVTQQVVEIYLKDFKKEQGQLTIDTLVLGCTHYPLLKKMFRNVLGNTVNLIDSATETALAVRTVLDDMKLFNKDGSSFQRFFVSDLSERFKRTGKFIMGKELEPIYEVKNKEV